MMTTSTAGIHNRLTSRRTPSCHGDSHRVGPSGDAAYAGSVGEDQLRRAADAAMLPIRASLAPAGVTEVHWLPDTGGDPVVWIRVATEAGRVAVESYAWVLPQVQVVLARVGVPPEKVLALRLEVTSGEAEDRLFEE